MISSTVVIWIHSIFECRKSRNAFVYSAGADLSNFVNAESPSTKGSAAAPAAPRSERCVCVCLSDPLYLRPSTKQFTTDVVHSHPLAATGADACRFNKQK